MQKRSASRALLFALFAQLLQAFEAVEHILNGKLLRALKVRCRKLVSENAGIGRGISFRLKILHGL